MKSKTWLLLKLQLMRLLNPAFFRNNSDAAKKKKILLTGAGAVVLAVLMAAYSAMFAAGYAELGMIGAIPRMLTGLCAIMLVLFIFLRSSGLLFGARDLDMVLSLPVKNHQVVLSRLAGVYLMGLAVHVIFLLPALVVYAVTVKAGPAELLSIPVLLLAAPVLPAVLAVLLGTAVMAVTSRLPFRQFFSFLFSVGILLALLVWSMGMTTKPGADLADMAGMLQQMIGSIYPPSVWAVSVLEGKSPWRLLLFCLGSLVALAVFTALASRFYLPLNDALLSMKQRTGKKARTAGASTVFAALLRKERRRLTSCTIYAMNVTMGYLLMLCAGAGMLFAGTEGLEQALGLPGVPGLVTRLSPLLLAMLASLSPTTAPSLSLEGKSRWIMCSLPVAPAEIFRAKIALNLILAIPCALISGGCFLVRLRPSVAQGVLLFAAPLCYGVFASVFGMFANVKFPSYDWTHEQQAVKSSVSVLISVFGGLVSALVPLALVLAFPGYAELITGAASVFVLLAAAVIWKKLKSSPLYA